MNKWKKWPWGIAGALTSVFVLSGVGCTSSSLQVHEPKNLLHGLSDDDESPLKLVGERLFRETRFSQFYQSYQKEEFNRLPSHGDSVVESLEGLTTALAHPYRGQSISCAACHLVDQAQNIEGGGQRAYTDFARRSPVPNLQDGQSHTLRNSPVMVGSSIRTSFFLHHDGEFATPEDLVRASMTGRNMGWQSQQVDLARRHIVQILRRDDGTFPTETTLGGLSYRRLLAGDSSLPRRFQIPAEYRIDIATASDEQVFEAMVKLVGGYLRVLDFKKDNQGLNVGSAFDTFLRKNHLPQRPPQGESDQDYQLHLLDQIASLKHLEFVDHRDGELSLHQQDFVFGPNELRGLQVFSKQGSCISCHAGPDFTDHLFHNTGVSQVEYEKIHGDGKFLKIEIPSLKMRDLNAQTFFRSVPDRDDPRRMDLGVWNVLFNPQMPHPQARLRLAVCQSLELSCSQVTDTELLEKAIGMIKTPTLRDLGHSQPYMHTGQFDSIEEAVKFYMLVGEKARRGQLRSADPKLNQVKIGDEDVQDIVHFLKSLNEDYN